MSNQNTSVPSDPDDWSQASYPETVVPSQSSESIATGLSAYNQPENNNSSLATSRRTLSRSNSMDTMISFAERTKIPKEDVNFFTKYPVQYQQGLRPNEQPSIQAPKSDRRRNSETQLTPEMKRSMLKEGWVRLLTQAVDTTKPTKKKPVKYPSYDEWYESKQVEDQQRKRLQVFESFCPQASQDAAKSNQGEKLHFDQWLQESNAANAAAQAIAADVINKRISETSEKLASVSGEKNSVQIQQDLITQLTKQLAQDLQVDEFDTQRQAEILQTLDEALNPPQSQDRFESMQHSADVVNAIVDQDTDDDDSEKETNMPNKKNCSKRIADDTYQLPRYIRGSAWKSFQQNNKSWEDDVGLDETPTIPVQMNRVELNAYAPEFEPRPIRSSASDTAVRYSNLCPQTQQRIYPNLQNTLPHVQQQRNPAFHTQATPQPQGIVLPPLPVYTQITGPNTQRRRSFSGLPETPPINFFYPPNLQRDPPRPNPEPQPNPLPPPIQPYPQNGYQPPVRRPPSPGPYSPPPRHPFPYPPAPPGYPWPNYNHPAHSQTSYATSTGTYTGSNKLVIKDNISQHIDAIQANQDTKDATLSAISCTNQNLIHFLDYVTHGRGNPEQIKQMSQQIINLAAQERNDPMLAQLAHAKQLRNIYDTKYTMPTINHTTRANPWLLRPRNILDGVIPFDREQNPNQNFANVWNEILRYTQNAQLTERDYIDILIKVCKGSARDELHNLTSNNACDLKTILDHLHAIYATHRTIEDDIAELKRFTRRENEDIKYCMARARSTVIKLKPATLMMSNSSDWHDTEHATLQSILFSVVAPQTRAAMELERRQRLQQGASTSIDVLMQFVRDYEIAHNAVPSTPVQTQGVYLPTHLAHTASFTAGSDSSSSSTDPPQTVAALAENVRFLATQVATISGSDNRRTRERSRNDRRGSHNSRSSSQLKSSFKPSQQKLTPSKDSLRLHLTPPSASRNAMDTQEELIRTPSQVVSNPQPFSQSDRAKSTTAQYGSTPPYSPPYLTPYQHRSPTPERASSRNDGYRSPSRNDYHPADREYRRNNSFDRQRSRRDSSFDRNRDLSESRTDTRRSSTQPGNNPDGRQRTTSYSESRYEPRYRSSASATRVNYDQNNSTSAMRQNYDGYSGNRNSSVRPRDNFNGNNGRDFNRSRNNYRDASPNSGNRNYRDRNSPSANRGNYSNTSQNNERRNEFNRTNNRTPNNNYSSNNSRNGQRSRNNSFSGNRGYHNNNPSWRQNGTKTVFNSPDVTVTIDDRMYRCNYPECHSIHFIETGCPLDNAARNEAIQEVKSQTKKPLN